MKRAILIPVILLILLMGLMGCKTSNSAATPPDSNPGGSYDTPSSGGLGGLSGSRGENVDGSSLFMSYAGPVFPLSILGNDEGITASREIVLDFGDFGKSSTAGPHLHNADIVVNDNYVLTNDSGRDVSIKILYPFAGTFSEIHKLLPDIVLGGQTPELALIAGSYSGGFSGLEGMEDAKVNLKPINSWEDYVTLLSDGAYLARAIDGSPSFDQAVTVYEFNNTKADHNKSQAATLAAEFSIDFEKTKILTYRFNGSSTDEDNNYMRQSFFVPKEGFPDDKGSFCLIALGDDVANLVIQGYENGGCNKGEEVDHVSADVKRYEATLGEILSRLVREYATEWYDWMIEDGFTSPAENLDMDMLYRAAAELLTDHGALADKPAFRYVTGRLDDIIQEAIVLDRVFYLACEIDIPAGESVALSAAQVKPASFDHYMGAGSENEGVFGYDIFTKLDSNLLFSKTTARISNAEQIDIVRQNFGFEQENEVFSVDLDLDEPHYYLEVAAIN